MTTAGIGQVASMALMSSVRRAILLTAAFTGLTAGTSVAQESRCADCHFANPGSATLWHLSDWESSAHGRKGVGCEACHGGDPTTFESLAAHRGIVPPTQFGSPMHRMNVPKTCGRCHPGPFGAFQKSRHYELLREGNRDAPTCATCHGSAGAYLPSPKALANECAHCHGAGKIAPNTDRPAQGKLNLSRVREIRQSLEDTRREIHKLKDAARRRQLESDLVEAYGSLTGAICSAHMFVFEEMNARLSTAASLAERLREAVNLAAPLPSPQNK